MTKKKQPQEFPPKVKRKAQETKHLFHKWSLKVA